MKRVLLPVCGCSATGLYAGILGSNFASLSPDASKDSLGNFGKEMRRTEELKKSLAELLLWSRRKRHWLGEAPLHEIACQIMESSGPSGHNVEYLLRLASFMKEQVPEAMDDHLFTLEIMVRAIVKDRNLCLKTLMGELGARRSPQPPPDQEGHDNNAAEVVRPDSFQFTSRVHTKKLRCLNI